MHKPGQLLTAFMDNTKLGQRLAIEHGQQNAKAVRNLLHSASTRGVKFIAPQGAAVDKNKPLLLEDLRPPYPVTVIEGHAFGVGFAAVAIIARDTGEHVELNFICHTHEQLQELVDIGKWIIGPNTCRFKYSDKSAHEPYMAELRAFVSIGEIDPEDIVKTYQPFLDLYFAVCQILANHNVETQDIEPDAKEARVRKIRGKAPLFTYKTLVIGAPKKRVIRRSGGTHASPRSHLRRGYYRTSKNGVRHWVRAAMVKGETPGFVHKDYLVEQQGALIS